MREILFWYLTNLGIPAVVAVAIIGGTIFVLRSAVKSSIEEGVKFGFSRALEEHKAQLAQDIEAAKTSLKLAEAHFSKQFEALVELRRFFRQLRPKKRHPEMDWDEAMEGLANGFGKHVEGLEALLFKHEAAIPTVALVRLEHAINQATDGQFEFDWDSNTNDAHARPAAIALANEFYEDIEAAVEELQKAINAQMPTRRV